MSRWSLESTTLTRTVVLLSNAHTAGVLVLVLDPTLSLMTTSHHITSHTEYIQVGSVM